MEADRLSKLSLAALDVYQEDRGRETREILRFVSWVRGESSVMRVFGDSLIGH
jgi:hypothetical protein